MLRVGLAALLVTFLAGCASSPNEVANLSIVHADVEKQDYHPTGVTCGPKVGAFVKMDVRVRNDGPAFALDTEVTYDLEGGDGNFTTPEGEIPSIPPDALRTLSEYITFRKDCMQMGNTTEDLVILVRVDPKNGPPVEATVHIECQWGSTDMFGFPACE